MGYKLEELARKAGTSPRTVRYYVQRGLLPAPAFRGKDSAYDEGHLDRLRAIRRLQEAFFPLEAIAVELARRTPEEIAHLAGDGALPATDAGAIARPIPAAPPSVPPEAALVRRWVLAEGVELTVAEDCPAASKELAARLLATIALRKEQDPA